MSKAPAQSVFHILVVLSDVMQGGRHSRHTAAARGGVSVVTADRWLRALLKVPGCRLTKSGKTVWLEWASPVRGAARQGSEGDE